MLCRAKALVMRNGYKFRTGFWQQRDQLRITSYFFFYVLFFMMRILKIFGIIAVQRIADLSDYGM